jgi:phage gp16-like protein
MNAYRTMAAIAPAKAHRRGLIAKVHIARTQLGLSDDDYRAVLIDETGHDSAAMLDERQLDAVVKRFEARGFTAKAKAGATPRRGRPADHPSARKARALWISLHQLGAIENPAEAALEAFARRQLGVDKLQWADQGQCYKLVEALKAIAERHGWSQDLAGVAPAARVVVLKRRLVDALRDKLVAAGLVPHDWTVARAAWDLGGVEVPAVLLADVEQLDLVARTFAAKLRDPAGSIAK